MRANFVIKCVFFVIGVLACFIGVKTVTAAQPPTINSIGGHSDSSGVVNGRWTGQPAHAPPTAANGLVNRLAVDSYNYETSSSNPYYWDIKGQNFGTAWGAVSIGPLPSQFLNIQIVDWQPTKIRIKVSSFPAFSTSGFNLTVKTAPSPGFPNGRTSSFSDTAVGIIKSRGYGQCTWFVAMIRMTNGLAIPLPSAYSVNSTIPNVGGNDNGYRPQRFDCLNYQQSHVAIITSTPVQVPNADGSTTWSFTVSEFNAKWDERESSSTRYYKLSKLNTNGMRTVQTGIGTNASSQWVATGCYR